MTLRTRRATDRLNAARQPAATLPRILVLLTGIHLASLAMAQPFPDLPRDETVVVRGMMPDSYPGSFAVVFPAGPALCFDPVRGGINFISEGTTVDFRPNWSGKVAQPATFDGKRFYHEITEQPLRRGNPDDVQEFIFEGYQIKNGYPVFHYRIGDCRIREELRPSADNRAVTRHFETDAPAEFFWLLSGPQDAALCTSDNGTWINGRLRLKADESGAFTVTIAPREIAE